MLLVEPESVDRPVTRPPLPRNQACAWAVVLPCDAAVLAGQGGNDVDAPVVVADADPPHRGQVLVRGEADRGSDLGGDVFPAGREPHSPISRPIFFAVEAPMVGSDGDLG